MIDKLKEAQEELKKAVQAQIDLNTEIESRDNPIMTEEDQKKWDGLKEQRSALSAKIKRLEEVEKLRLETREKEDTELRKFEPETKAVVKENRAASIEGRNYHVESMLCATILNDMDAVAIAQRALKEGGHYSDIELRDGYSTFKDSKGGIFIPTSISNEIFDMEQQFGVIPQYATNFGINGERKKIPSIIGRPTFSAVNERSAISGSGTTFGGILLDTLKWGCIVDWTNEIGAAAGSKILPILMRKVAEAGAYLKDDSAFNADGTSSYHNLKGFITLAADSNVNYVRKTSADTGDATFATLDADDFLAVQFDVSPSVRERGVYVMHPDMKQHLLNLQDGQGQYIYGGPAKSGGIPTLWGRPLLFSEAFPITDGADKPAALYFDPSYFAYGTGQQMSVTRLTEATITDEDGSSINLATQDAQALRFLQYFDFQPSNLTTTTAGTAKGAFAVLYTAAS